MKNIIPALFFLIALVDIANADSMRCGNNLVSDGDSAAKVILRCGQPFYKEVAEIQGTGTSQTQGRGFSLGGGSGQNTFIFNSNSSSTTSQVAVEKWHYDTGEGQFIRIVTLKGGVVVKIETGDKP